MTKNSFGTQSKEKGLSYRSIEISDLAMHYHAPGMLHHPAIGDEAEHCDVPEMEPNFMLDFISELTGDQEVPSVETDVMGMANLSLNKAGDALSYSLTVNGLDFGPLLGMHPLTPEEDDDVLFVHIHEGLRGENGPVVFDIISPELQDDDLVVTFNDDGSTTLTGVWDFDDVQSFMEFAPEFQMAEPGEEIEYYFNVHSVRNPGGEVRGQIAVPEVEPDFISELTGDQEVPPVETDVMGMAKLNLSETGDALSYSLTVNGLDFGPLLGMHPLTPEEDDDVLFVHIHEGLRGENGPVVFDIISPELQDDDLVVTFNEDGSTTLTGIWDFDDVQSFIEFAPEFQMAEPGEEIEYYFNVHSVRNPGGEVRGQIIATGAEEDTGYVGMDEMDELSSPGEPSPMEHIHSHGTGMEMAESSYVSDSSFGLNMDSMGSGYQPIAMEPFMSHSLTGMQPSVLENSYALA